MGKYVHLLLSGHGRINQKGIYTTAPSKMWKFPDGLVICEGEENYNIKQTLIYKCETHGIEFVDINPEPDDISLKERVKRIRRYSNQYIAKGFTPILHEIHLNAFNGKAFGTEIWTTVGKNNSDLVAEEFMKSVAIHLLKQTLRRDLSDGDSDKEKDWYVIYNSPVISVLYELFFFDNRQEVDKYCNPKGYKIWSDILFDTIKRVENGSN